MGQTNPQTGSEIEVEAGGDFTVTFSMSLPPQPVNDADGCGLCGYRMGHQIGCPAAG